MIPDAALLELRMGTVTRQLDDLNVLGEALVAALRENDFERIRTVRASMERYALAMGWSRDNLLPAILAYANGRPDFDDELFAPAFILKSTLPEHPETKALVDRLSEDARVVVSHSLPGTRDGMAPA